MRSPAYVNDSFAENQGGSLIFPERIEAQLAILRTRAQPRDRRLNYNRTTELLGPTRDIQRMQPLDIVDAFFGFCHYVQSTSGLIDGRGPGNSKFCGDITAFT